MDYKVEFVNISDIKMYSNNAKKHDDEQVNRIAKSIKEFGFRQNLVIEDNGTIVIGHGRYLAAKKLGLTELPCIRVSNLTDEQIKALRLADNKVAESDWDFELLGAELDEILNIDMSEFGFNLNDEEPKDIEIVEDDAPSIPKEPKTKPGDLYILGNHKLICGDSTDVAVIDRLMDGVKADIAFTSPPYNAGNSAKLTGNTHMTECKYEGGNDDLSDYDELLVGSTDNMLMFSKWAFINLQMLANNKRVICEWLNNYKDSLCDIAIWYKNATAPAMAEKVMNSQFEFIFIFSKDNNSRAVGTKTFRGTVSNVYQGSAQRKNEYAEIHSATFPMEFVSHFVSNFTETNDTVLDVFGGTGTTLIACEQLNRKCYMAELDPKYCDVILQRYINFKGSDADVFLLKDGKKIPYSEACS